MKEIPKTLKDLIRKEKHDGFKLAVGHFVALKHTLMGIFPAIESESEEIVMTTNFELIKKVCATLYSREFNFHTQLIYVNPAGIAYSIINTDGKSLEKTTPYQTLTEKRFEELISKNEKPFKWTPGLFGGYIPPEKFEKIIQEAVSEF